MWFNHLSTDLCVCIWCLMSQCGYFQPLLLNRSFCDYHVQNWAWTHTSYEGYGDKTFSLIMKDLRKTFKRQHLTTSKNNVFHCDDWRSCRGHYLQDRIISCSKWNLHVSPRHYFSLEFNIALFQLLFLYKVIKSTLYSSGADCICVHFPLPLSSNSSWLDNLTSSSHDPSFKLETFQWNDLKSPLCERLPKQFY